jgi:hypothetical protein
MLLLMVMRQIIEMLKRTYMVSKQQMTGCKELAGGSRRCSDKTAQT